MKTNLESNSFILTITIASVSLRKQLLTSLIGELEKQINENNLQDEVEILIDDDDDKFLGTKRKEMVAKAKGLFTCAIDDDDWISENYVCLIVNAIKNNPDIDCVGINGIITTNGQNPKKWIISCHYKDWFEENDVYYRTPNHICPIKTELVKIANFDDVAWGEDYPFSQRVKVLLNKEILIEEPLYVYKFNTSGSLHNYQNVKGKEMKAIISFANSSGNYMKALQRLEESVSRFDINPFLGFRGESSIGSPLHSDNPYAFKIYAFKKAIELGYTKILYVDSSVVVVKELSALWQILDEDGYFIQEAGHFVGRWCNDRTLAYFSLTREDAMEMKMYGNAGILALDFEKQIAKDFFNQWERSMLDGQFKGDWSDHRHDMTCGSIIANNLNMKLQTGNEWVDYVDVNQIPKSDKILFHAQGM